MNFDSTTYVPASEPNDVAASVALPFTVAAGYTVRELTAENSLVSKFMNLHHKVLKALPNHGQHWVKRRIFASVKQHLKNGHVGLGVFDANGKMVGQALLTFPDLPGGQNLKGYPIGYGHNQLPPEQCIVIQTLGVSKNKDGQFEKPAKGIGELLLQKAEEIAHQRYRRHLLAKTDKENTASIYLFEKKMGYQKSKETIVAGEDYTCVFMYKPLSQHAALSAKKVQFGKLVA